ncbi:hybrid-cluster NAD(P)-dependent oxidoreductase [Nocardioides sp. BGMRC 2183]|nr:hybrid-cluster NAD(P)-dependent oxidoreductase [Nocardioides sp. BGMRC 2183]
MSELSADPYRTPAVPVLGNHTRLVAVASSLGAGVLAEPASFDLEVSVRRIRRVTHDVVTIVLDPLGKGPRGGFAFAPGQYVTVTADVDGEQVERCYTISSPPTRPHLLTLTVKREAGGRLSPWLHDRLAPGDRLRVRGPLGGFSVVEHPAASYLLMSAGSGITPTLSTLRAIADLAEPLDVVVVHHARTPLDLIERAEIEALAASQSGVRVVWVCEAAAPDAVWDGHLGRVSPALLHAEVPDLTGREIFLCGPPGYLDAARDALDTLGVDPSQRHEERFILDTPEPGASAGLAEPVGLAGRAGDEAGATIRFARSDREVDCPPGTTVLAAAAAAGLRLPSGCTQGLCGTCKSTLLDGDVDMRHAGGIRPREVAAGRFLPCCSTPLGDIVVDA